MSRHSFPRHFRPPPFPRSDGVTVSQWLNLQRVEHARQLLESSDLPAERITQAGFGTPLSMRQQFAAQLGTTPSDYRRSFQTGRRGDVDRHPPGP